MMKYVYPVLGLHTLRLRKNGHHFVTYMCHSVSMSSKVMWWTHQPIRSLCFSRYKPSHVIPTCPTIVLIQIPIKIGFLWSPLTTLRWPWILRALISLKSVIMTKVLKMMVKCCEGAAWSSAPRPLSMSNNTSPAKQNRMSILNAWCARFFQIKMTILLHII